MESPPEQLDAIRCGVRERVLAIRSLERLLMSDEFGIAYSKACDHDKHQVVTWIGVINLDALRRWVAKRNAEQDYADLSLRELRGLAQRLGVPFYSRLPKASLLSEISKYEKARTCIVSC